jgi:hypothetical protein
LNTLPVWYYFFKIEINQKIKKMTYNGIFAALVVAIVLTVIFSGSYRHNGPFGGLLFFFLILFLASWAGQLWIHPITPFIWGIGWVPLVFVAFLMSFILTAAAGTGGRKLTEKEKEEIESSISAVGIFFWVLLLVLLIAIVTGYYITPPNIKP